MPPPGGAGPNTGAVTTIVPSETDARVPRVEDLLRAVPGLEVTKLANGAYRLRIRGQRSLRGDAGDENPLLVIDGIAIPNESMGAMLDDLSSLQRTITGEVLRGADSGAPAKLVAAWEDRNRRSVERAVQLFGELRATSAVDAAMLSVALRELRNLA